MPQQCTPFDRFDATAQDWQALELLADKWRLIMLYALAGGTRRHGELRRAITGISPKMLTQTLRHLERDGLVARTVFAVVPPRVEYQLTPLGRSALEPLEVMCHWAATRWPEVLAARAAYEEQDREHDEAAAAASLGDTHDWKHVGHSGR